MAMILPKAFVDKLRSPPMVKLFCDYDDYNWDFSLFNAVQENIKALRVYIPQIPHVFHLGKSLFDGLKKFPIINLSIFVLNKMKSLPP